jgi:hypothetical protein
VGKREKLLEKARNSQAGWGRQDIDSLYRAWGFEAQARANHTWYRHPSHSDLYAAVTRSSGDISRKYVEMAIELIELIEELIARG